MPKMNIKIRTKYGSYILLMLIYLCFYNQVTKEHIYDTLILTFWNHILFIMPSAVAQWVWVPAAPLPELAPTLFDFVWHQLAGLFIFDFQYFVWHMTHHKVGDICVTHL